MKKVFASVSTALLITACAVTSSYAIFGIGVHYGLDFSLDMKDQLNGAAVFDSLKVSTSPTMGVIPPDLAGKPLTGADVPIFIDRSNWKRNALNIGGKIYVDCIPFIDAVELSGNMGLWEYLGVIKYPDSISFKSPQPAAGTPMIDRMIVHYAEKPLTLENFNVDFLGMKKTPYAKVNADLTIRKYIVRLPKTLKILNVYGGAGVSCMLATPVVSAELVKDALGDQLNKTYSLASMGTGLFGNNETMKAVTSEILKRLLTPHFGAHIDVGTMIKIPVVPIGVYIDGKFVIPFGKLDENVDVGGMGLLVNTGIALHF